MSATVIEVRIGDSLAEYRLHKTTAPAAYDGHGTKTIYDGGDIRYVLVRPENEQWQYGRYQSGLFATEPSDDFTAADLRDKLIEALEIGLAALGGNRA